LNDLEWDACIGCFPPAYLDCYISDTDLKNRVTTFGKSRSEEIVELLPTEPTIQSGDFGEILCYFLFKEIYKALNPDGPKKWRWKQQNNVAAPYTDVLLFHKVNISKPHKNDHLISIESKMKVVDNKSYRPIENAIKGAQKDSVSRIAHSLAWLRKKYKEEALKTGAPIEELKNLVSQIERHINSETTGEYKKIIRAVAVVDKNLLDEELKIAYTLPVLPDVDFEVIIITVKDLKKAYQTVFSKMVLL
jgi:hypothetical protein